MNKRLIYLLLVTLMIFTAGCNSESPNDETHVLTTEQTDTSESSEPEVVPGVTQSDLDDGNVDDSITTTTEPELNSTEAPNEGTVPTTATDPTAETNTPTESTESTEPTDSVEPTEAPTEATTPDTTVTDYEAYEAMSADEQMAFIQSFDSYESFVAWYNAAKAEYDAAHPDIEIGDGNIDIGDITGGK